MFRLNQLGDLHDPASWLANQRKVDKNTGTRNETCQPLEHEIDINDEEKINLQILVILICKLLFWGVDEAQDRHKNIKLHRPNVQYFSSTEQDRVQ